MFGCKKRKEEMKEGKINRSGEVTKEARMRGSEGNEVMYKNRNNECGKL